MIINSSGLHADIVMMNASHADCSGPHAVSVTVSEPFSCSLGLFSGTVLWCCPLGLDCSRHYPKNELLKLDAFSVLWLYRYWAVALPVYLCVVILLFYLAYLGLIFINTSSLTSVTVITGVWIYLICYLLLNKLLLVIITMSTVLTYSTFSRYGNGPFIKKKSYLM